MSEEGRGDWLRVQIPKMKELWDNEEDEAWGEERRGENA